MTDKTQMTVEEGRRLVALVLDAFFTRTDTVAALMEWGSPHPIQGHDNLPGLLQAHILGEASPHRGAARYENRQGHIKVQKGLYRIGSYTPDKDGNTRWLCLDFDGAGHSDPLADPESAARQTQDAFASVGIPAYLEKSGGGKGWHVWVLFSEPVSAKQARALAHRLIPDNLPLANSKGAAMPRSNRGVEVFPKQDKPATPKRLGNLVWLPWFHGAPEGANQFYRMEDGRLVPFVPDHFNKVSLAQLAAALEDLDQRTKEVPGTKNAAGLRTVVNDAAVEEFLRRADKDDATTRPPSSDWQSWKESALAVLDLQQVYGRWLTGKSAGEHWLQCQDPDSDSGSNSRSGNVADGTGQAIRGTFHSWRTEESMSVFDFMVRQGMASSFIDAARQIAEWTGVPLPERPLPPPDRETEPKSSYPVIVVNGRQTRDIRFDAEGVLSQANSTSPFLFVRARRPVRIVMAAGEPHISEVDQIVMFDLLAQIANWVRRSEEGDFDVPPVHDVARMLVASPSPSLPLLDGVVTAPVFDATGALVDQPGYHRPSGVWYHQPPGSVVPPVPECPSPEEIAAARNLLVNDLLVDFPFVCDSDRAHAIAAIILPFVRRMVLGPTPVHLYEAPSPGSGKTLAAELVYIIATGDAAEPTTMPQDDEEVRKKITSLLLAARPVVLLDNVRGGIDSVSLAAVLTAEKWTDRLLGGNELAGLPNRAVWLVSANNPTLTLEIARRCIRIRVEPADDRPWERRGFKHWPLKHWVLENRSSLVHAVLVLVRAWISRGRPQGKNTLGSFEHWAATLGGILSVAGIPGFLENTADLYEAADVDGQEWREFVSTWWSEYGTTPVTSKALLELATANDLLPHVLGGKSERAQAIRLGKGLAANRNRMYGTFRIELARVAQNLHHWRLTENVAGFQSTDDPWSPDLGSSQASAPLMLFPVPNDIHDDIHVGKPAPNLAVKNVVNVVNVFPTFAGAGARGGDGGHDSPLACACETGDNIHDIHHILKAQQNGGSPNVNVPVNVPRDPQTTFTPPTEGPLFDLADLPDSDDEVES